ncbi:feruloyl-CoA synthase [Steroidobacter agaridevorans]|uniref:Feruloyl-CoA synthase n=1 Tax=Steroidobacter agaridevorans TaxID=2695856 RepID=A0A829YG36_9GAMM|nr:feruloyl-CoA synthase [Steroidobacter agaridevorans]GFE82287.1 feruloyl-CoA synthase [Steroidobacter agaridevorans]
MQAEPLPRQLSWTADPFHTEVERRADGTLYLRPTEALSAFPERLMDSLEHWAKIAPQRVLVARRVAGGEWQAVTYQQMLTRVRRIAAGLLTRDLSAERPLAIFSGNSIEHLTLAFAAMWAGIPYCPVSPSYSQVSTDLQKLRYVLDLLTPGLIAAFDTPVFARALQLVPGAIEIVGDADVEGRKITSLDALEVEPTAALDVAHARTNADTIAKFLLTSGSTGQPKAVITTNRMLCSNAHMLRQPMPFLVDEPPVLLDWLPWNHTFGGSHNVGLVLCNGGSLYIDDGKPTPSGIQETLRNLREIAPTVYFNVPKGFEMLAHHLNADAQLRRIFYSRLRAYFFGGAALAQHTWDALDEAALKEVGVRIPMLAGLGATETGPSVTFTTPAAGRAGLIGLPAKGNIVKLAPVAEKLELRVRGPNVTPGYWRQPELTAAAFDEEQFYRLGDAVRLLDDNDPTRGLAFDGRIGEDFKLSNGTWVSVGPLRAELIAALSPIAQDVVIAGLNAEYLAILIIPDLRGCGQVLASSETPAYDAVIANPALLAAIQQRLIAHARQNRASTRCVCRALVLPTPPSLDKGEITDKGSINQRAVLKHRASCVDALYAAEPPPQVVRIE